LTRGLLLLALVVTGCASAAPEPAPRRRAEAQGIPFVYGTTEGGELSSATTRGRATAIVFVTTYDLASQVQAKQLEKILRRQTPRINVGAVVLEAAEYALLADAFRTSLSLSYPVAMADRSTLSGHGPFGDVEQVPTTVVLDRSGREVWRKVGLAQPEELEAALASASRHGFAFGP
jgi:hypothetical protein